uniref:Uncharacterized protein n=1 Tax=Cacopsylla melanoneura TaxID=428564 RepID=A0A8D8V5V9_9HEMI
MTVSMDTIYQIESLCAMCGKPMSTCRRKTKPNTGTDSKPAAQQDGIFESSWTSLSTDIPQTEISPDTFPRRVYSFFSGGMGGVLTWTILLTTFLNGQQVLCQQNSPNGYEGLIIPSQIRFRTPGSEPPQPQQQQVLEMPTPEQARRLLKLWEYLARAEESRQQSRGGSNGGSGGLGPLLRTEENNEPPMSDDQNETSNRMESVMSVPLPLYVQNSRDVQSLISPQEYINEIGRQDKRGSYMALCHFKICNMGRKRTFQERKFAPWLRPENN